ncbi:MAG: hypothetical protein UX99_C0012G0002 [Candidatus Amesbacteria bacterium GW2011_GWB1_47_26]|uniref:Integral membrane protein n=1 Tax=Candidatus Amesbacteria bacterium GW2011_GWC2_45_19 TaxID=1618366 RepID=A0A0G1Q202_9BACT|nr:MAG: hypothetical protein UX05_C0009G0016 [Candidatus Amesbacteria bacterium GW2011_GWC2_45_19]KKU37825.1 MAG: hypothetical protein UX52_C0017G0012 [Candidatus Amesbacteria bacterium GW2011_GWA1_46_35]KKU69365.1 MAG: hypothetical protein UX93_C0002G0204 [Microgenomates group bacterium GW2011_GWC1_47_20]KKU74517.1 MAG: hypothetical protein UX99_C0012G0002 [Candidatus Amesbacteria bacterium GW2011_GWB1_47_26]KKU78585.1 MAG: hypothetical protein UY06_C0046G0005 [Candidatus Amesbacteria bacteriu
MVTIVPLPTLSGIGPLGTSPDLNEALFTFANVISITIGVLTISAGLWFIIQIFSSAFQWLTSGGEKQALQNAQKRLTHAIIGLLMVVLSYALIGIVSFVFGLPILNIAQIIISIRP